MYRKSEKNEFYTRKAKEEGYPARSVYKLQEIDEKYKIIRAGDKVLDLGCAPGSWLLYVSKKVGKKGEVFGIDTEKVKIPVGQNIKFLEKDIMKLGDSEIQEMGKNFQAVVSDLSPKTSGIGLVDAQESFELSQKALELAKKVLKPGGSFVCKIFEGESANKFFGEIKKNFEFVKRFRPKAVRKESREIYIICKGFGLNSY